MTELPYGAEYHYDSDGGTRYKRRAGTPDLIPYNDPAFHAKVYAAGDYYGVPGLKARAVQKFWKACRLWWETVFFAEVVGLVVSSTPHGDRGLRSIVFGILQDHPELLSTPESETLRSENEDFAEEVVDEMNP